MAILRASCRVLGVKRGKRGVGLLCDGAGVPSAVIGGAGPAARGLSALMVALLLGGGTLSLLSASPAKGAEPLPAMPMLHATQTGELNSGWSLDRLLVEAMANNPSVFSQQDAATAAHANLAAARWQYFPSPSVEAERGQHGYQLTGALTQPLLSFGRIGADVQAARARAAVADLGVDETRYTLGLKVVGAYGALVGATRAAEVLEGDIARLEALEAMMRRRVATGVSAPVDHNLVLARLSISRNALTTLRAQESSAAVALSQLVGHRLAPGDVAFDAEVGAHEDPVVLTDTFIERKLDANPALRRVAAQVDVARAESRQAKAAFWPTVFARAEQRLSGGRDYASALPDTRLVVGLQFAFGAGLSALERDRAARAQASAARHASEAYRLDLMSTIAIDRDTLLAARRLIAELKTSRLVQQQTFESYNRMFLAGKRSWLDVLNVMREQTDIERALVGAEVQQVTAAYRLGLNIGEWPWK